MELVYKGRYFNGKSSTPYMVDITWFADGMLIRYMDEKQNPVDVKWEKAYIHQTELSSGIVTLRYGDIFPQQQLEVTDPDFIRRYKQEYKVSLMHRMKLTSAYVLIGSMLAIALGVWLSYIWLLPVIADYGAKVFPKEYEIKLGQSIYEQILAEEEIDSAKTANINRFFATLNVKSDYPIRITVVKSPVVNAFALPGGGIVVYEGILKDMQSSDQLAALLSHEFSHVQLKHATRNMFRTFAGYIFISVIFGDLNGVASILIENAHQLRNLSYSRELETEADNNGLKILRDNNISAGGMKKLFELLKSATKGMDVNEFISTHPDLDNRIRNADQFMIKNPYRIAPADSLTVYYNAIQLDEKLQKDTTW